MRAFGYSLTGIPNPCTTDERQSAICQNVFSSELTFQRVVMNYQLYQDVSGHYPALKRCNLITRKAHALAPSFVLNYLTTILHW